MGEGGAKLYFHMCKSAQGSGACSIDNILKNSASGYVIGVHFGLFF